MRKILAGSTSRIARLFIQDSSVTTGAGLSGLVFNTAGLTAYYIREGDASATAITLVTATVGTYTSSGFKEISSANMPGAYELHLPNAAIAAGAKSVTVALKGAANMVPVVLEVELDGVDYQDATRFGLAALPNVAAGANGGLPTGNASGQVALAALDSSVLHTGTAQGGATGSITLATGADSTHANFYRGALLKIVSGTGAGQARVLTGYTNTTRVATVNRNWIVTPDNTSVYAVWAADAAKVDDSLTVTAGAVSDKTGYALSVTPPTAAAIAALILADPTHLLVTDASGLVTAAAISTAARDDIVAHLLDGDLTTHTTPNTLGLALYRINTGQASVLTPFVKGDLITVYRGDDINHSDGRDITLNGPSADAWPDLTGATVVLKIATAVDGSSSVTITGTVVTPTGLQVIRFNPTHSETTSLVSGLGLLDYRAVATLASTRVATLAAGKADVRNFIV